MTAITNQDFTSYNGDDVYPIFTVYGSDLSTVVDISTVTQIEWFALRGEDLVQVLNKKKTLAQIAFVTSGVDGKFQVTISKTDTAALNGYFMHYARITDALGNITTIEVGRMRIGPKPLWTYDPNSISTTSLYQVRRLIGDVIANDPQMWDAEIAFEITQRSSIYGAAANCCRNIAAQYSRKVDVSSPGGLTTNYAEQAKQYLTMAREFERIAATRGAGISPYMGGISNADKATRQQDTDRVAPSFNIGMHDNLTVPGPPVGNETPTSPQGNMTNSL